MLQDWLVVDPYSKFYTVLNVLFHKYGGANFGVTNCMSHFNMSAPTKDDVKWANSNMGYSKGIRIILCHFTNWTIIYPMGPVYYFTGHPSITISLGAIKCYIGFKKVTSEPTEHCYFMDPKGYYWWSPYRTHNSLEYIKIQFVKVNIPEKNILWFQISVVYWSIIFLNWSVNAFVMYPFKG